MPIRETKKNNIKEICQEWNIDYEDFLLLLNKKGTIANISESSAQFKAIFIIEEFSNHILRQEMRGIKSRTTKKYYFSFLSRLKSYILQLNKDLLFSEINEELIFQVIEHSNKKLERSSINTYMGIMKLLCSFATEKGFCSKNLGFKFKKIKVSYLPRYFTNDQLKEIFKLVEQRRCPLLWQTIFITLLGTGLRVKELESLKIKDVNFKEKIIYTLGKGNKERYVPLYPQVEKALLNYLKITGVENINKANDSFLFSRTNGHIRLKPVSARSIQYNLLEIRTKLGFDSMYTVHSFRHTFAVNCLKSGMQIMFLCQILGHESPSTTSRYTKLIPKDLQVEITEKYPLPLEEVIKELITGV